MGSVSSPVWTIEEAKAACALGVFDHCLDPATRAHNVIDATGECWAEPELLAPICGWFTKGFETPDLIDAKTLLYELH